MKIIIAGDGKVGSMLASQLSALGHDLTLIDNNPKALENTIERYDVMSVVGNCCSMEILRAAGIENAELLITATGEDELNLLCCMTAHELNPDLHAIARVRNPDYSESTWRMSELFALSMTVNPEKMTAEEIDRMLRFPVSMKREKFADGLVEIVELKVEKGNKLCNRMLKDIQTVAHCQVLVCAVLRDGEAVTPSGDFVIHEGDRLYVTASSKNLSTLLKNVGVQVPKVRNVTIIGGGGRNGFYLTRLLTAENISVKVIESDEGRCERLAEAFPRATVIHGDASHSEVLEREKIEKSDAVIVMTGIDEQNVILSIYAKNRNVPIVITKLGRAENLEILESLPIGTVVSPKIFCCSAITNYVQAMHNQIGAAVSSHPIADGAAIAYEFIADENTKYTGVPLKSIHVRNGVRIASITRNKKIVIPNGESTFLKGDRIVIVAAKDTTIRHLNDMFADRF